MRDIFEVHFDSELCEFIGKNLQLTT